VAGRRSNDGPLATSAGLSGPVAGIARRASAVARSVDARRVANGHHTAAATIASTSQTASASCQPKAPAQRSGDGQRDHRADVHRRGVHPGQHGRAVPEVAADDDWRHHVADGDRQAHHQGADQRGGNGAQ